LDKSPELTKTNQESEEETKQKIELPVKSTCSADNKIAKIELDNSSKSNNHVFQGNKKLLSRRFQRIKSTFIRNINYDQVVEIKDN
jgi:hypothetical protein